MNKIEIGMRCTRCGSRNLSDRYGEIECLDCHGILVENEEEEDR